MWHARCSIIRLKIRGNNGQPWRIPFVMGNGVDRTPEVNTCTMGVVYKAMIAENIGPPKPKAVSTLARYPQCTRSNAFSASNGAEKAFARGLPGE